jgi:predicted NAD-dependent protein-ADP-ribosyltransferase YbiA (DUF1768 family)
MPRVRFIAPEDEPDTFQFYSQSAPAPAGTGKGERVTDRSFYRRLDALDDQLRTATQDPKHNFRHVLSNFHVTPFHYKGRTYKSIEHAFHAQKMHLVSVHASLMFSLESGSDLSKGNGHDAWKQRRMELLPPDILKHWDSISLATMADIARAKYAQCPDARNILVATHPAQLIHFQGRNKG